MLRWLYQLIPGLIITMVLGGVLGYASGFINDWIRRKTGQDGDPDLDKIKAKIDQELGRLNREALDRREMRSRAQKTTE